MIMFKNYPFKMLFYVVLVAVIGCAASSPAVARSREEIDAFRAFLEKSRTDDGVRLESRMLSNPQAKAWENSGKYQGDILLDDEQVEYMVQQFAEGRNAYQWPDTTWPDNTVVYEFARGFDAAQIAAIEAAMRDIERNTCIRFRPRIGNERAYVRVTGRPDGCYAHVGFWAERGVHTFNVAMSTPGTGCFMHNIIVHEWLHIIGFFHMQSTHNRDDYVRILWENIWEGMEFNFEKYPPHIVDNLGLPYEYDSNMHYDRWGFSKNGQPTMLPIYDDKGLMGQLDYVTPFDWLRVDRHYNCPGAWETEVENEEDQ